MIVAEEFAKHAQEAELTLRYQHQRGRSTLIRREHYGPLVVQKPFYPEGEGVCHSIIVHPPGGIVAGDRLRINIAVEEKAHALITTPGATKWYRSEGAMAQQTIVLKVAADAALEWLPQEAIVFNSANARQSIAVELGERSRYVGWDILMLGRTASQEKFIDGCYEQAWHISRNGAPLWLERGQIVGGSRLLDSPAGLAGCSVIATLIAIGKAPNAALVAALRAVPVVGEGQIGITALPELLSVRYLGHRVEAAKLFLQSIWRKLRPHYFGRAVQTPRIWST